jgi:NAD(P)-dependent dehydrogenase (short-subunit alcohol dehydrogenase family)
MFSPCLMMNSPKIESPDKQIVISEENIMSDLKGKNVVVAGGTSGIGFAIAKLAAEAGANVWALGRTQKYIDEAKKELGDRVTFLSADIHDSEALKKIFEQVGTIDHLVGNATGANRTIAPFMQQTAEQFQEAFGKFWGYTNLVRTGVPFMTKRGLRNAHQRHPRAQVPPGHVVDQLRWQCRRGLLPRNRAGDCTHSHQHRRSRHHRYHHALLDGASQG